MRKYFFVVLILGFIGYAGYFFADSVTPYVGIAEARTSERNVQVKGLPDDTVEPHMENNMFVFSRNGVFFPLSSASAPFAFSSS